MSIGVEHADGTLRLTLDRPAQLNALTIGMVRALHVALDDAARDEQVRVVVLAGAGRAFCSGVELGEGGAHTPEESETLLQATADLVTRIRDLPKPVVAAVGGPAAGVGVSLVLAADLAIARADSYLALPFAGLGLMPDGGATLLLAAAGGRAVALRLALLGERLAAPDAVTHGLIAAAVEPEEYDARVAAVVSRLASGPTLALGRTKQAVNAASIAELRAALDREIQGQMALIGSEDFAEAMKAWAERRAAVFQGR
ncbi:enoyl-CoA hydratase-related protein [Streptomyces hirsutus]|uniref:enoyl-CoA hydratase-related protein n=1 Tax=Streptomyces hirsutus TaxID=35620 RepID=UPI003417AD6A